MSKRFIGEIFSVWKHLGAPPPKKGRYIELTAGLSGGTQYNQGLITNESVSGSFPAVNATATISVGPMAGQTIRLINTERRFVRPGSSGILEQDQEQQHTHARSVTGRSGSINMSAGGSGNREAANNSPTINVGNASARTSAETRAKNVGATYYLRVL